MPMEHPEVLTSYYYPHLPKSNGRKFPVGEPVTVLCHFANEGDYPLNITAIMGSLNKYDDFHFYVQNFTFKEIGAVVESKEEITLAYTIDLDERINLVPRYKLSNTVFYEELTKGFGNGARFSSTFQNSTVELYTNAPDLDVETALQLLFAFVFTSLVTYMTYLACNPVGNGKTTRALFTRALYKKS